MAGTLISSVASSAVVPLQEGAGAALGGMLLMIMLASLAFAVISIAGMWKTFEKAGQPGWASIIPIYNTWVLIVEVADRDALWFILSLLIPFAMLIPMIDVAKNFGKGAGYGLGLYFFGFIFFPLLGFGDARYQGSTV